jgi:hypothetical protein
MELINNFANSSSNFKSLKIKQMKTFQSDLSNTEFPISGRVSGYTVILSVLDMIKKDNSQLKIFWQLMN